jgi:hypothetical protein
MSKTWKYLLMAALVLGLGMNVTSCKDDNDDENNERTPEEIAQDPYEKESEAADALYRLVSQLSVCDSLPNDWKTATFEPKAGKVLDQSQPRVRTIAVNNAAEAVARYNSLTGKDLPVTTMSDTYTVKGVGTLQLNVGGAGTIATIDVDVKQMPQLAQLRLVSAADMGENGSFKGEPYYSFGDVVRDNDGCYWICVRPAYSPNSKEDTHWMSFHVIDKNIKTYTRKGGWKQKYPVDLGVQKEKMQYLAQLLAIMINPDDYKAAAKDGNYFGGTGLGGLQEAAMPVDSLMKQAKLWNKNKVWEKIMPVGFKPDEVETFQDFIDDNLFFFYEKGSISGKNLVIRAVEYTDVGTFYRNEPNYEKVNIDMEKYAFNVTDAYTTRGTDGNYQFGGIVPDAFVVRYKNGYQLSSNWLFNPSPTDSIPGVTTIHRFKDYKNVSTVDDDDNESYTTDQAQPGMMMAKDGKFYKSNAACKANNTEAVALVVYVGKDADTSGNYRGLAMSYSYTDDLVWDESDNREAMCTENADPKNWADQKDGISRTQKLSEDGHNHPAAKRAWNYKKKGFDPATYGFSNWFLPTVGQLIMVIRELGGKAEYNEGWNFTIDKEVDAKLKDIGAYGLECWTSTESNPESAVIFELDEMMLKTSVQRKNSEYSISPFIAF